ncbi:hypothetical protein AVEN_14681-1 [Araneus ventricosus]|uniref:Uncharacterized protein n=1 Tax=Araneus ventricosus TaxID=182803 RepID=A0A4Y2QX35_ARAVE|nr:hypothetical protein AVEN_14679-1 [Araneus ventricosus]GBN67994.1 hypothetical protein AVEN_14681-1 [Araneus ventricosus]
MRTSSNIHQTQPVHPTPTENSLLHQDLRLMEYDSLEVQYLGPYPDSKESLSKRFWKPCRRFTPKEQENSAIKEPNPAIEKNSENAYKLILKTLVKRLLQE